MKDAYHALIALGDHHHIDIVEVEYNDGSVFVGTVRSHEMVFAANVLGRVILSRKSAERGENPLHEIDFDAAVRITRVQFDLRGAD